MDFAKKSPAKIRVSVCGEYSIVSKRLLSSRVSKHTKGVEVQKAKNEYVLQIGQNVQTGNVASRGM